MRARVIRAIWAGHQYVGEIAVAVGHSREAIALLLRRLEAAGAVKSTWSYPRSMKGGRRRRRYEVINTEWIDMDEGVEVENEGSLDHIEKETP